MNEQKQEEMTKLYNLLNNYFDEEELKNLSFDLAVDYENLRSDNKYGKCRELVKYFDRRNNLPKLLSEFEKQRPDIDTKDFISLRLSENAETPSAQYDSKTSITSSFSSVEGKTNQFAREPLRYTFPITGKNFEENSNPQKIIIQFTNQGNQSLNIVKVKYSSKTSGLPWQALLPFYKRDQDGRLIIVDSSNIKIAPSQNFVIELCLGQIWRSSDIYTLAGEWGYLYIFFSRDDLEEIECEQYST